MIYEFVQQLTPQKIKRFTLVGLFLVLALVLFIWLYSYGFIEISVANSSGQKVQLQIIQNGTHTITASTSDQRIRRLVHRGSYQVFASNSQGSAVMVTEVGGFLRTKQVQAPLKAERARRFVGNNPLSCMSYAAVLYSYTCGGALTSLVTHEPATDSQPTYINKTIDAPDSWFIRGAVPAPNAGLYVLVLSSENSEEGRQYYIYEVDTFARPIQQIKLDNIDANDVSYQMQAYKDGFIVYNEGFTKAFYYRTPTSQGQPITINASSGVDGPSYVVTVNGDSLVAAFPNVKEKDSGTTTSEKQTGKAVSRVVVGSSGNFKSVQLGDNFNSIVACGTRKLCAQGDGMISVFDISGGKPLLLYRVMGVSDMQPLGGDILYTSSGNLVNFDVDKASGYISYSYADYRPCGLATLGHDYIVCVLNAKNERNAIFIQNSKELADPIDKKINELRKLIYISSVSIYDNHIYIAPNLGKSVNNAKSGFFNYDPTTKQLAKKAIIDEIDALGINRSQYTISIPLLD